MSLSLKVLSICDYTKFATGCVKQGDCSVWLADVSIDRADCVQRSMLRSAILSSGLFSATVVGVTSIY